MQRRSPLLLVLFLTAVIALTLVGCGDTAKDNVTDQQQLQPLKIGVLPVVDSLPFYIAEAEGMFKDQGLTVELIPFPSPQEISAALQAGQIDGMITDMIVAGMLKKGGTDLKVATVALGATPEEGRFAILAAPESGIKSVADLKGKEVAISQNSVIEFVLDQILMDAGLAPTDVKKLSVPKIPVRMQILQNNQVAAAVLPDPMAFLAEQQGATLVADDTARSISQSVLVFRQQVLNDNGQGAKGVVEAYGDAGQALTNNPERYQDLVAEKANIPKEIKDTFKVTSFSKPQSPAESDVQQVLDWMVSKNLLDQPFSYQEFIDTEILR
ncbi:MetQ/NlpA family ABC transporter substrate-binding protein [Peptococcaceae bacterium 1198_IL3148]